MNEPNKLRTKKATFPDGIVAFLAALIIFDYSISLVLASS